jgi:hypothetical protein
MKLMFFKCKKFDQPLNHWDITRVRKLDRMFGGGCPIRESYRPGYVYVSPTTIKRQLDEFYDTQGIHTPTSLSQKCNDDVICPITQIRLKHLHRLKRLVILDGRCYAFYAFIHPTRVPTFDPINRRPFSTEANAVIATLRTHKDYLTHEFDLLPASTFDDTPPQKTPTPPNKTRSRARKTRSLSLPRSSNSVHSRKTRKTRSI